MAFPQKRWYLGVSAEYRDKKVSHWIAKVYDTELGRAMSPEGAAAIVCEMGQASCIEDLAIPSSVHCPRSVARYQGVCYRKPGAKSKGGWWVGKKRFFPGPSQKSFLQAINWAAKQKRTTPEKLRRRPAPRELTTRLRALSIVLGPVPADLQDLAERAPQVAHMFKCVPLLLPLFLQAKMGPWRHLMQEAWMAMRGDPLSPVHCLRKPLSQQEEAKVACDVLVMVTKAMAKSRLLRTQIRYWNALNLGVQHHSGFVPMCLGLQVLDTGGHMDLGMKDVKYKFVQDTKIALTKLQELSEAWKSLSPVLCVPKTLSLIHI